MIDLLANSLAVECHAPAKDPTAQGVHFPELALDEPTLCGFDWLQLKPHIDGAMTAMSSVDNQAALNPLKPSTPIHDAADRPRNFMTSGARKPRLLRACQVCQEKKTTLPSCCDAKIRIRRLARDGSLPLSGKCRTPTAQTLLVTLGGEPVHKFYSSGDLISFCQYHPRRGGMLEGVGAEATQHGLT